MKVLDIGSGWGGLALTLARDYGADVTGVTLSTDQYETSQAARQGSRPRRPGDVQAARLSRTSPAPYDRIVSVGMFEHVGLRNFGEYFRPSEAAAEAGRRRAPAHDRPHGDAGPASMPGCANTSSPAPICRACRSSTPLVEERNMWLTDFELLRVHYAEDACALGRALPGAPRRVAAMHDERFCRMWEFYLVLNEVAFRHRSARRLPDAADQTDRRACRSPATTCMTARPRRGEATARRIRVGQRQGEAATQEGAGEGSGRQRISGGRSARQRRAAGSSS